MEFTTTNWNALVWIINYVCQTSSRYSIQIWNVYDNIRDELPRTNNAAEGYNYRISTIFPPDPHIYEFVRRLKDEHQFQHHKSEEAQLQVKKRKKFYEKIDEKILELMEQYENGQLTPTELAIKLGKTVKIQKGKNGE